MHAIALLLFGTALGSDPPPASPAPSFTDQALRPIPDSEWLKIPPASLKSSNEGIKRLIKLILDSGNNPFPCPFGDPLPPPRKRQHVSPIAVA
jgi:hypothetical protein